VPGLPVWKNCRRHRCKHVGRLVKLKLYLARSTSISWTRNGLLFSFVVSRCLLDPIDTCLTSVTGLDLGFHTCPHCFSRLRQRGANLQRLRTLPPGTSACRTTGCGSCRDWPGKCQISGKENVCPEGFL
ncbi:hypothetical protein XENOCAPTIV_015355, partial [Xenoophorus captivus]